MRTKPILRDTLKCHIFVRGITSAECDARQETGATPKISLLRRVTVEPSDSAAGMVETDMRSQI